MTVHRINACLPPTPLAGDDWARRHPEKHAQELAAAKAEQNVATTRFIAGESVPLGELAPRTTQQFLNDQDAELRKLAEGDD